MTKRGIILMVFLICTASVLATDYYINPDWTSASSGTFEEPWTSFSQISGMQTGDDLYIKHGTQIKESLTVNWEGTSSNRVIIGCYDGNGDFDCTGKNLPVISGADVLSDSWVYDSGNVYYLPSVSGPVHQLFRNSEWVHLAHEPDGYHDVNGHSDYYTDDIYHDTRWMVGETGDDMTYTNAQISGATLVAITAQWFKNIYNIDRYEDDTIYLVDDGRGDNYATQFHDDLVPNPNRYWLADKRLFLDSENEWYYDSDSDRLYAYQPGGGTPSGTWEVTRRKYGIYARNRDDITVRDIEVRNTVIGIYLEDCSNFDIDSVSFNDIGSQKYFPGYESTYVSIGAYIRGFSGNDGESGTIQNSNFNNVLRIAILGRDYANLNIIDNTIINTATVGEDEGFGPHGGSNSAIHAIFAGESVGWLIKGNYIDGTGYDGIHPARDAVIEDNIILNTMMYMGDGGAVYAGASCTVIVRNNYIDMTGLEEPEGGYGGTKKGIYIDSSNSDCLIENNMILNTGGCLFNNGGSRNEWLNNTCINYTDKALTVSYAAFHVVNPIEENSIVVKGNKFLSEKNNIFHIGLFNFKQDFHDVIPHEEWFAEFDYNTYCPDGSNMFYEKWPDGGGYKKYDFAGWQSATGLDQHSTISNAPCVGSSTECSDGIDNDGDGNIDMVDDGCTSTGDDDETNCGDGVCEGGEVCDVCVADCGTCQEDLVGHWTMDSDDIVSGKVLDKSGNGNDATIHGAVQSKGHLGEGLYFDGTDDYLETDYTDHLPIWTISAWIKADVDPRTDRDAGPVMKQENILISYDHRGSSFRTAAGLSVGGIWYPASFGTLTGGNWYHLAASYDGETLRSYIDGVPVTQNTDPSGDADVSTHSLKIGKHAVNEFFYQGIIDEVRVYSGVLSDDEIQNLFDCHPADSDCSGCIEMSELMPYIEKWKQNQVVIGDLIEAIGIWKSCS